MQDYNYVWAQCLELTLEISCCKFPPETQLPGLWEANKPALLAYMQQVHLGRYSIDTFAHIKVHNAGFSKINIKYSEILHKNPLSIIIEVVVVFVETLSCA